MWTPGQRLGLVTVIGGLLLALSIKSMLSPAHVSVPQADSPSRAAELLDRIDPNTADWAELAALPVIGKSLAQRIVAEREVFRTGHPGEVPYRMPADLLRVKGIGEATLAAIEPYLRFPELRAEDSPGAFQPRRGVRD